MNASSAERVSAWDAAFRGRRSATWARARWAICRPPPRTCRPPRPAPVAEVEHVAEQEHRALGRRQRLQHEQHRRRQAVRQLEVLGDVGRGQQGLGQPRSDVVLPTPRDRAQPVEGRAGHDPHQVCAGVRTSSCRRGPT